jgi:hypothetical protein
VLHALLVVAVLLVPCALAVPAARPRPRRETGSEQRPEAHASEESVSAPREVD